MSPNEQKLTSGREAMAIALSRISIGVTQTGQPGPWIIVTCAGSISSRPKRTMACVCPPQTSMIFQGRVVSRAISPANRRAASASRYSSTYFMAAAPPRPRPRPLVQGGGPLDLLVDLADLVEVREYLLRLLLIDAADGEAHVDDHVIAHDRFGRVGQADFLGDAAKLHLAHRQPVLLVDLQDPPRYS